MEYGLKGTSRTCRGRHGVVGIVEFGHSHTSFFKESIPVRIAGFL